MQIEVTPREICHSPREKDKQPSSHSLTDDNDFSPVVQPVHERQEGGDDAGVDLVLAGGAHGGKAINLIEENHRGTHVVSLKMERLTDCCLHENDRFLPDRKGS